MNCGEDTIRGAEHGLLNWTVGSALLGDLSRKAFGVSFVLKSLRHSLLPCRADAPAVAFCRRRNRIEHTASP